MSFRLSIADAAVALLANLRGDDLEVTSVGIDSRTLEPGGLYVAIRGERHDGHDFIAEAGARGASALLVDRPVESRLPQLVVGDTVVALGTLASWWARRHPVPVVAITGSNGKTTTKEIVATILRELGPVLATAGNLNNDIGVPLTLLGLRPEHRYAVIEMGASRAGDIARLAGIVAPDVALVTNTGAAHLEGFGSLDGVARAKAEIFAGLAPGGTAVINIDDERAAILVAAAEGHLQRTFGVASTADVRGIAGPGLQFETFGRRFAPAFELAGDHNGMNALAAIAAVQCLDVQPDTLVAGLAKVRPVAGRVEEKPGVAGAVLIDDSYNANPVSARAAIDLLARRRGRRHLVLGEMLELGVDARRLHAEVGKLARSRGIERLWTVGELPAAAAASFGSGAAAFETVESLVDALLPHLEACDVVLVKGSRGARMERVIAALSPAAAETAPAAVGTASGEASGASARTARRIAAKREPVQSLHVSKGRRGKRASGAS